MITFKSGQLSTKDRNTVEAILQDLTDSYSDYYITKSNLRLFIKENMDILFESLKKGDKIAFSEEDGIIFIHGWSDGANRNYIKILSKDQESAYKLIKLTLWHLGDIDLYAKVKKNNPVKAILENSGWKFKGNRGQEVLLYRKGKIKEK